jgi:hypothetical protein
MDRSNSGLAGRAVQLVLALALACVAGTEACEALVTDSLPSLPCQPDNEFPSETCPPGQQCSAAGWCVQIFTCDGAACLVDALADGASDAVADGAVEALADDADNSMGDGSSDALYADGGDDGGGVALGCVIPGSPLGCPCTGPDSKQCGSLHCDSIAVDAGADDASGGAAGYLCSHGCHTDDECVPFQCSSVDHWCTP